MKFSEMTYTRPDIDALLARCKELAAKAESAASGEALVAVYYEQSRAFADYNTAANLASIHYTCDTRDAAWKAEQDFFDANGPAVQNASVEISRAFLANPHVDALTDAFGTTCVAGMKNAVLGMDDRTIDLQKEYNALVSQYQQVYGGALVEFDGKQLTIPQLGPYKENLDPAVRRAAYEAEAGYFDAHRAEWTRVKGRFADFTGQLIEGIASFDPEVRGLRPQDCTYRIARDTRFSPDKSPYKTYIGAYIAPKGKKSGFAGYYFHIEPCCDSLVCCNLLSAGAVCIEPTVLRSIREEVLDNGAQIEAAIRKAKGFRLCSGNRLKRVPTGFPADSPYAEMLKLKDFYLEQPIAEEFLLAPDLLERTVEQFRRTQPFIAILNRAIRYAHEEMQ